MDDFSWMKPIVLVTGFGPFVEHPVNASWEAVKLLPRERIERAHDVELVTLEIPVTYESVDEFVPQLWDTHSPKLVIHVGVSALAKQITVECMAHRKGYKRMDYLSKCPSNHEASAEGAYRLKTGLNVDRICEEFPNDELAKDLEITSSCDAGRYLCEYIYYTSLSVAPERTLFIHVPPCELYAPVDTARALTRLIDLALQQVTPESAAAHTVQDSLNRVDTVLAL